MHACGRGVGSKRLEWYDWYATRAIRCPLHLSGSNCQSEPSLSHTAGRRTPNIKPNCTIGARPRVSTASAGMPCRVVIWLDILKCAQNVRQENKTLYRYSITLMDDDIVCLASMLQSCQRVVCHSAHIILHNVSELNPIYSILKFQLMYMDMECIILPHFLPRRG